MSEAEHNNMTKWISIIGYAMLVWGLFMLSPLSDLLPVDLWHSVKSIFATEEPAHVKIVPASRPRLPIVAITLLGVVLVLLGRKLSDQRKK